MPATSSALCVSRPRFGRPERTEIRADFARDILADMKAAYLADDRPWVVGFSGRKDSTALGQFRWCPDRLKTHPVGDFIKAVVARSSPAPPRHSRPTFRRIAPVAIET